VSAPWFRRFGAECGPRLYCFPHAGGTASFFLPFSASLDGVAEVVALQYPGRQDRLREPLIDSIPEIADRIASVLPSDLDRPSVFFGHSMGSIVAYEVARRLDRQPAALIVSGRSAPTVVRTERTHEKTDDELLASVALLGGSVAAVLEDEDVRQMILPALRSDYVAAGNYRHADGPLLACPITVFVGVDDPVAPVDECRQWVSRTTGRFSLREFSGGHFYLADQVAAVSAALSSELDQIRLPSGSF
jgi:pyochelin biosynthetic protein PchC